MIPFDLVETCAPTVAAATIQHIVQVESGGNRLALNVNAKRKGEAAPRIKTKPRSSEEAASIAKQYIEAGYSVDLGLMQVNSRNLTSLGYTVQDMFEPCNNLAAGAAVLTSFYRGAVPKFGAGQRALLHSLSAYNTGDYWRGFSNNYVARYQANSPAQISLPVAPVRNPLAEESAVYRRKENRGMNTMSSTPMSANGDGQMKVYSRNFNDASVPGVQVQVDADDAEALGAFRETALGEEDAWDSNIHLEDADTTPDAVARGSAAGSVVQLSDVRAAKRDVTHGE
ncbi:lytic transglycosylase domain-containing protein [Xanthomonas perforans]|uniref:lytic transglycosylase domain-containing protein n=1 Tax=Xanthomonas perforans TaxID=442694 RepID=UPI00235A17A7|nr:lytic transglycosylase domain-containing protein [Xanthomonas perforans]MDC9654365.1 lytic transglycosylase domain-containing protein [Xanthomonas perforans]MEB2158953.1 lytic transglycosylase domain-containing protein [Xanthomonas campestris pv. campestris]